MVTGAEQSVGGPACRSPVGAGTPAPSPEHNPGHMSCRSAGAETFVLRGDVVRAGFILFLPDGMNDSPVPEWTACSPVPLFTDALPSQPR